MTAVSERKDRKGVSPADRAFVLISVGLIFAAHYFYGAMVSNVTMVFGLGFCGLLGWALANPLLRGDIAATDRLAIPTIAFLALIAFCLLSLTPYLPGGAHPVWEFTGVGRPAVTIDKSATVVEVVKLLILACIFAVGVATGGSSRRGRLVITAIVVFGALFGVWAFFAAVTDPSPYDRRLEAHFLSPNTAGTLFAVLLMIGLAVLLDQRRRTAAGKMAATLAPLAVANLVFLVCLLMSASRGAILAALAAGGFLGLAHLLGGRKQMTRGAVVGVGVAAAGMVAIYFAGGYLAERFVDVNEAAGLRSAIWAEHWKAFQASPLAGYGLGTSESVNKSILGQGNFGELWNIRGILNVYLQWLEQAGVIGASVMFLTIGSILAATVMGLLKGTRAHLPVLGLLAVDIVFLVHGATDFALEMPSMAMLWAYLLGLQLSLSQRRQVS